MWARVKGKAENAILRLPFRAAYVFRPAGILAMHGETIEDRELSRVLYRAGTFVAIAADRRAGVRDHDGGDRARDDSRRAAGLSEKGAGECGYPGVPRAAESIGVCRNAAYCPV